MRRQPIDHCPRCGVKAHTNTYCATCEVDMVDANGYARIEPTEISRSLTLTTGGVAWVGVTMASWLFVPGPTTRVIGYAGHVLGSWAFLQLVATVSFSVWGALQFIRYARRAYRRLLITPVGRADSGRVAIRGHVVAIVPPVGARDGEVAATIARESVDRPRKPWVIIPFVYGLFMLFWDTVIGIETRTYDTSVCGRFAVVDETGVVIVDDDAIVFLDQREEGRGSPLEALRDGDIVEVFGRAVREEAMDASILAGVPPEHAKNALVMRGDPEHKVWVAIRRTHAEAPARYVDPEAAHA